MTRLVLFSLSGKNYALPLEQMVRIGLELRVFSLPRLPFEISGVIVEAGGVVPVLRASILTGVENDVPSGKDSEYSLIARSEYGTIVLPADRVRQIVAVDRGLVAPLEDSESYSSGTFMYKSSTFNIINIDYLVLDMIQGLG